ncbi:MAG TPA: FAD-binding oxidoreductase [Vicinamibacterales bacterium]|nr:FAD-binding oxidoreductase [Vicinamibacterales bacterium]
MSQTLRQATGQDAIDGVIPRHVALPESPEELAQILAHASRDRQLIVLRGGGSKLGWGRVPSRVDLVIGTEKLNRLLAHRHGDMTVTAQAGMPLAELNRRLAEHRQYLPIESAFEPATIGGIVATNDSGPTRHRFGTPRDLLIGVTLAMTDGRLVKAGGTVVKNVAGYDLGRLVSGSHGTLAAIVDATFKLLPIPLASTTLVATYADGNALAHDLTVLRGSQVELSAFDMSVSTGGRWILLMRMASSPAATAAQAAETRRLLSSTPASVSGDEQQSLWDEQIRAPWAEGGTIVRLSWLPSKLPAVVAALSRLSQNGCQVETFTGRALGSGLLRLDGDESAIVAGIAALRASEDVGHVVMLRATPRLKSQVDVWGPASGTIEVARTLKRMFDPADVLNAGRGPI